MKLHTKARIVGWLVRLTCYALVAWSVWWGQHRHPEGETMIITHVVYGLAILISLLLVVMLCTPHDHQ